MDSAAAVTAVIAFAATNIDDFCVLVIFFARCVSGDMRWAQVAIGQTLGFTVICAFSLLGIILGVFVPPGYVGLIGFLPLVLGFIKLVNLVREKCFNVDEDDNVEPHVGSQPATSNDPTSVQVDVESGNAALDGTEPTMTDALEDAAPPSTPVPTQHSPTTTTTTSTPNGTIQAPQQPKKTRQCCQASCIRSPIFEVALITVANGGDNIGVYIPLFASSSGAVIVTTLVIFYLMLVVWLIVSYNLVRCPLVADTISRFGEYIVPFVLMGLGLYILWNTVVFNSPPI